DAGRAGAARGREDVIVQIILDGVHLAEETARVVWQSAAGRVALVTDAVAAAGNGDGTYLFGGSEVVVREGTARGPGGVLAGSTLTMIEAVRNLHGLGIPLEQALAAASTVPARVIGLPTLSRLDVAFPAARGRGRPHPPWAGHPARAGAGSGQPRSRARHRAPDALPSRCRLPRRRD